MGRVLRTSIGVITMALVGTLGGIAYPTIGFGSTAKAEPCSGCEQQNVRFFLSPSGNISCELDYRRAGLPDTAYCVSRTPQQSVSMNPEGVLDVCTGENCMSDPPLEATTLGYGQTTGIGPFTCRSEESGMTCTVTSGRGFTISASGIAPIG